MATTRIEDIFDIDFWSDLSDEAGIETNAFLQSGVVQTLPVLNAAATAGGSVANIQYWQDLDGDDEENISSDDPDVLGASSKISAAKMTGHATHINKIWSAADLANEIAGDNALDAINRKSEYYFSKRFTRRVFACCEGIVASNIANDDSDMVVDISVESGAGDDNYFSRDAFVDAKFTMGDNFKKITGLGVHTIVYSRIVKLDDTTQIPDSQGNLTDFYLGSRIIVDDQCVVTATTDGVKYTSVLFGEGAFGYGLGTPQVPVEYERVSRGGNGGGVEYLTVRKSFILHPLGMSFDSSVVTGSSPTIDNLSSGDSWTRVQERKNVPLAFLITNG